MLSPIYSDLKGFPPTLLVTSTRDLLLSGTVDFHRALLRAGVQAELVVFDALPHAFWYDYDLPETKEALDIMARFFDQSWEDSGGRGSTIAPSPLSHFIAYLRSSTPSGPGRSRRWAKVSGLVSPSHSGQRRRGSKQQ